MDDVILDEIHDALINLRIYSASHFWFRDFLSYAGSETLRELVRSHVRMNSGPNLAGSPSIYLQQFYGVRNPQELSKGQVAEILMSVVGENLGAGEPDAILRRFVQKLGHSLSSPSACATLMSSRSFFHASLRLLRRESEALRNAAQSIASRLIEPYEEEDDDSLEPESSISIIREFLRQSGADGWQVREYIETCFNHLYALAQVEERYPLYATQYALVIPTQIRATLSGPMDQIIAECKTTPELIRRLSPHDFERFLGEIFRGFGYDVHVTSRTRDGGVDVLCLYHGHGVPFTVAVEAKRYKADRPVTVSLVRSFVGANATIHANKLVYVTTSRYTRDAVKYAQSPGVAHLLELKEFPDIVRWVSEHYSSCVLPKNSIPPEIGHSPD